MKIWDDARTLRQSRGKFIKRVSLVVVVVAAAWCMFGTAAAGANTFTAAPGSLGAIPDGPTSTPGNFGAPRDVTFNVSGFGPGSPIDVTVSLTISHTWVGDLDAVLIAPNGEQATIFSRTGASTAPSNGDDSDLVGTYTFSDRAPASPTWWQAAAGSGATMTPGDMFPTSTAGGSGTGGTNTSLTQLLDAVPDMNGTWKLRVKDGAAGDTGSITGASLDLAGAVAADSASLGVIPDAPAAGVYGANRDVTFPIAGVPGGPPGDITLSATLS